MLCQIYLRRGIVFIPSVARTEAGIYREIEPVMVVPAKDMESLRQALAFTLKQDNPLIPAPSRAAVPKPVLLTYAKAKSWSAFEKDASVWTIERTDSGFHIKPLRKRPDRGWEADPTKIESIPAGVAIEAIAERAAALIQMANAADQPRP